MIRFLLCAGICVLLGLSAADPVSAAPSEEELQQLQQQADQARTVAEEKRQALEAAKEALNQQRQKLAELTKNLSTATQGVPEWEKELKPLQDNLKKAQDALNAANAQLEQAKKEFEAAKGTENEKAAQDKVDAEQKKVEPLAAEVETQTASLRELEARIEQGKKDMAELPEQIEALEPQTATLQEALKKAEEEFAAADQVAVEKARTSEKALIEAGKLVSFAESVAPVFAKRCLACHNARTAKGRYNMENFAGIMKGGESGEAIIPGDPILSGLYALIEDGSMPKDADPLTEDEIARVEKWIQTGARLDAGLDPNAPLITIMPKQPHPQPPSTYAVPIPITALAFSPDGTLVASSGYHEILLWKTETGELVRRIPHVAERIYDLTFTQDGATIIVAAGTPAQVGEVRQFLVSEGSLVKDFFTTEDSVFAVALSPDGQKIASAAADRSIRVFDVQTGKQELLIEDHADWVMDIAWSPDGKKLASASRDKTSKVYNAETGESIVTFNGHNEPVLCVAFLPDGNQVISGGNDKQLRVWKIDDGKQVRNMGGFGNDIFELEINQDGQVFTACGDKNARVHLANNGQNQRTFSGHQEWIYSIAVHPTTKRLATGSYDGEIRIWNIDDGTSLKTITAIPGKEPTP